MPRMEFGIFSGNDFGALLRYLPLPKTKRITPLKKKAKIAPKIYQSENMLAVSFRRGYTPEN